MYVIHNPTAGRRNTGRLWNVLDCLASHGIPLKILETQYAGHATELARKAVRQGADMVVAAGGDGTIAEVVSGMMHSDTRLGIIPLGTANVLAHEFNLPFAPKALAAVLGSDSGTPLWPGILKSSDHSRLFVQMVGAGFDAHVVHHIDLGTKRLLGRGAYVLQTVRELPRYQFPSLCIRADGKEYHAASVIVSKGRLYGGPYLLSSDALPGEPGFSVTLFENGGVSSALMAGISLPQGKMGSLPGVQTVRASHIEITTPEGLPVQADGDPAGMLPFKIMDAAGPVVLATGG